MAGAARVAGTAAGVDEVAGFEADDGGIVTFEGVGAVERCGRRGCGMVLPGGGYVKQHIMRH